MVTWPRTAPNKCTIVLVHLSLLLQYLYVGFKTKCPWQANWEMISDFPNFRSIIMIITPHSM